jgi:hypothetical protein
MALFVNGIPAGFGALMAGLLEGCSTSCHRTVSNQALNFARFGVDIPERQVDGLFDRKKLLSSCLLAVC